MKSCCFQHTNSAYEAFLEGMSGRTSVLTVRLNELFSKYKDCASFFRSYADIRVANLEKYATAQSSSFRCPECGENATLVVLSAPLLLLIWRIAMIYMRLIKRWDFIEDKIIVEIDDISGEINFEFREMLDEYLAGTVVTSLDTQNELDKIQAVPEHCRNTFFSLIDLAQMWVISHEVSHAISDDVLSLVVPEIVAIRIGSKKFVELHDLYPRTEKLWEEEFNADLTGIYLLYMTEFKRLNVNGSDLIDRETIASHIGGGVGLACEAIFHIVQRFYAYDNAAPDDLKHPPLEVRWMTARNYISHISSAREGVALFYLAETIGRISKLFIEKNSLKL